ncbi:uncharacterized protein LOC126747135 [Anthonomus grandis grandis]|uniref:uncharacterized protein LOC126747135 n=1 Tax=Anthonomus grandis grandis TaxID=2921223 RepID=UPI002166685E|nr:uncharacterized protein LOC126747135 [Anthonomus grandis grandis]
MTVTKNENAIKIGLGVWVCFCALLSLYVFIRFLRGKQRVFNNLHVVEESLRMMQEALEVERRKKSIGFIENLEDIIGGVDQEEEGGKEKEKEEGAAVKESPCKKEEEKKENEEEEEEDKKNV